MYLSARADWGTTITEYVESKEAFFSQFSQSIWSAAS